jgi:hypothetical protein
MYHHQEPRKQELAQSNYNFGRFYLRYHFHAYMLQYNCHSRLAQRGETGVAEALEASPQH